VVWLGMGTKRRGQKKPKYRQSLRLLDESIAHWERMTAKPSGREEPTMSQCPLCQAYYEEGCRGCPVFKYTGQPGCAGTPYGKALCAWLDLQGVGSMPALKEERARRRFGWAETAAREICFLEGVRSAEVERSER